MNTSKKKKCCYFVLYESDVEDKSLITSAKSQDFEPDAFFVKKINMENIAD